jgi:hypothetical protein
MPASNSSPNDTAGFDVPAAVSEYLALRVDDAGRRAMAEAGWWQRLRADAGWCVDERLDPHRGSWPFHFILGRMSPWYIEALQPAAREKGSRAEAKAEDRGHVRQCWAVFFGPYTSNGSTYGKLVCCLSFVSSPDVS